MNQIEQELMVTNLVASVSSDIRIKFGVIPGMTPALSIKMAEATESLLLDYISRVFDVRAICAPDGTLRRTE